MDRIDLLKNLMIMAAADGRFTETELQLLSERCTVWGLSQAQFDEALEYAVSDSAELQIPPGASEREELMRNLIRIMAADGQLAEIEKDLFAIAAATMEMPVEQLNQIIDEVINADLPPE